MKLLLTLEKSCTKKSIITGYPLDIKVKNISGYVISILD